MGIKPRFTPADVSKMFEVKMKRIDDAIIARLQYIGETFVNNARRNNTYRDITGNLRSSIGYIILKNGRTLIQNFEESAKGSDKSGGVIQAKKFSKEIAGQLGKGYVLVVVAGMDYAAAVESLGKDVLTASSIIAKNQLREAIRNFKKTL